MFGKNAWVVKEHAPPIPDVWATPTVNSGNVNIRYLTLLPLDYLEARSCMSWTKWTLWFRTFFGSVSSIMKNCKVKSRSIDNDSAGGKPLVLNDSLYLDAVFTGGNAASYTNGFPGRLIYDVRFPAEPSTRLIPEINFVCDGTIVGYTAALRGVAGVIKFWGPRENGDPPVPIFNGILGTLLWKWGPLPTVQAPQVVGGT